MNAPTPAEQQADLLRALANHLDAHPDLAPLGIDPIGGRVTLHLHADTPALLAWARVLGAIELVAQGYGGNDRDRPFVSLDAIGATVAGRPVRLRGYVHDVPALADSDHETIALDDPRLTGGAA